MMTLSQALLDSHFPAPKTSSGFKLTPIAEVMKRSLEIDWVISGYLPADSTAMIFGAPASGKSLIAMEMAYCVGLGVDYHGCPVKQGTVIYIAGEGQNGINKRFKALTINHGVSPDNVHVSELPMDLHSNGSLEQVMEAIENISDIALIIIDTLHRNSTGDENSAKDFAIVMQSCDQLRKATGATILLVHHSGHEKKARGRGSSSINGALDVEYQVTTKGTKVTMCCTKAKDIETPPDIGFTLNTVVVGKSTGGDDITAPVLVQGGANKPPTKPKPEDQIILDHLKHLLPSGEAAAEGFHDSAGNPVTIQPDQLMIHKKDWAATCKDDIKVRDGIKNPDEAKRKSFSRSLERLFESGEIAKNDADYYIIPQSPDDEDD